MVNFILQYQIFFISTAFIIGLFLISLIIIIPIAMESLLSVHSPKKAAKNGN